MKTNNIKLCITCLLILISYLSCSHSRSSTALSMEVDESNIQRVDLSMLNQPLENVKVHSKNIDLADPKRGMQSFGIDKEGNVYYSQISGSGKSLDGNSKGNDLLYISRVKPGAEVDDDFMTLQYFGHGSNIVVEDGNDGPYIWISSNATKLITGDRQDLGNYWIERSVSRIKYEKGKHYQGYGGETYFLNRGDFYVQLAAIDENSQYICFVASVKNDEGLIRNFYTFSLTDVKAAPIVDFEFSVKVGGENAESPERMITQKVKGYDLSKVVPLGKFSFASGKYWKTDISSYPNQGIDIDRHGRIYFYEGVCASTSRPQGAYVTIFNIHGNVIGERTAVNAIMNASALERLGFTDSSACMEAEGIKVIGNRLFLGFAAKLRDPETGKGKKGATIFEYRLKY